MPRRFLVRLFLLTALALVAFLFLARSTPRSGLSPTHQEASPLAWKERVPSVAVAGTALNPSRPEMSKGATRTRPVAPISGFNPRNGASFTLPLFDGRTVSGTVRLVKKNPQGGWKLAGRLNDGGTFTLVQNSRQEWSGLILPKEDPSAYRLAMADDGGSILVELPRNSVLCAALPRARRPSASGRLGSPSGHGSPQAVEVPLLNSRSDAEPTLFLDFDGATVTDIFWNGGQTIQAADSGLSSEAITALWRRVAEDYRPFRINVTTDPARYAAALPMQRMRCIITTSNEWYGEVGGVAGIFSWREAGVGDAYFQEDVPCWAFSDQNYFITDYIALAVSHEIGHTLGLSHDGLKNAGGTTTAEYYEGHGSGVSSWGPIMGAPYDRAIIQWNNGDYASGAETANNPEQDVSIIRGIENHTGVAPDRRSATQNEAGRLTVSADGTAVDHRGLVESGGAESWLLLAAGAGSVSLQLTADQTGDPDATNFDGSLTLTTLEGTVLVSVDSTGSRFPQLDTTVTAGVYVLKVRSVGEGNPASGGYSNYGSIGRFRVQGALPPPSGVAPVLGGPARVEGRSGDSLNYAIEAAGTGLTYSATGLPLGLSVGADGQVTGTPTQGGIFTVMLHVQNAAGQVQRSVVFAIAEATLAAGLDAPALSFASGGDRPWRTVAEPEAPAGGSSARSGEVLDNFQQSWIETTLTGPGRLKWRWKVSSEEDYDFFNLKLDGSTVAFISGETAWAEQTRNVSSGTHTLRWSYEKDPYLAVGQDSAWLDDVRWDRGFELWAEAAGLDTATATPGSDPDGDGLVNLLEYAFDLSPTAPASLGSKVSVTTNPAAQGALEIAFDRPAGHEDVRYTIQVSSDLLTWANGHAYGVGVVNGSTLPTTEIERTALPSGGEHLVVRDLTPGTAGQRFIRVLVTRP